jgi:hypothetical protein
VKEDTARAEELNKKEKNGTLTETEKAELEKMRHPPAPPTPPTQYQPIDESTRVNPADLRVERLAQTIHDNASKFTQPKNLSMVNELLEQVVAMQSGYYEVTAQHASDLAALKAQLQTAKQQLANLASQVRTNR